MTFFDFDVNNRSQKLIQSISLVPKKSPYYSLGPDFPVKPGKDSEENATDEAGKIAPVKNETVRSANKSMYAKIQGKYHDWQQDKQYGDGKCNYHWSPHSLIIRHAATNNTKRV